MKINAATILFLLKGELILSYNCLFEKKIQADEMIMFSALHTANITVIEDIYGVFCTLTPQTNFCDNFPIDHLVSFAKKNKITHTSLPINREIRTFLTVIETYWEKDLSCNRLDKIKLRELIFLLRKTYSLKELTAFFHPILSNDIFFRVSLIKNYPQARTVAQLAEKMGYSTSGFTRKFLRCFEMTPYKWMQQQKATIVLKELKERKKTIKDIYISNRFSSQSHFYEFCKKEFGKTPGKIRNGG